MPNPIQLDPKFSTTRLAVTDKPLIALSPEDKFEPLLFLSRNQTTENEGGLRTNGYFKKSYPEKPLISIITVVYNGEKYLEETIQSVINQTYDNVEYIIIDGGSTDTTLEIIRKYDYAIDYWISEKDHGLYHAMNKGLTLSTGDIIGMINADDYYMPNVLESIKDVYTAQNDRYFIIWGDILKNDGIVKGWRPKKLKIGLFAPHPSMFCTQAVYKKIGLYRLWYKIASDYDFMYRAVNLHKIHPIYLPKTLVYFRDGGLSSQYIFRALTEEMLAKIENGEKAYKALSIYLLKLIKKYFKKA